MKKIGILTTYYSENYGAALQAYALQKALESMNCDVELIRYRNLHTTRYILDAHKESIRREPFFHMVKRRAKNLKVKLIGTGIRTEDRQVRKAAFDRFIAQFLRCGKEQFSSPEEFKTFAASSEAEYDLYICGSDQVWNPQVHHFDPVYLLDFQSRAKRVSYAPSIAVNKLSDAETKRLAASVGKLDQISVREKDAVTLLSPHLPKKQVRLVADPTFLLNREAWQSLASNTHLPESYILVYMLEYNSFPKDAVRMINDYARTHHTQIICLPYTKIRFGRGIKAEMRYDVAPNDFIALLVHAKCVFTNSFHATALSINNNKEFYVFLQSSEKINIQSRIHNLLETFHLQKRGIHSASDYYGNTQAIQYDEANEKIEELRQDGFAYLKTCLDGCSCEGPDCRDE